MNSSTKEELTKFLEKILEASNVQEYHLVKFSEEDNDINFIVNLNLLKNKKTKEDKNNKDISKLQFILYCSDKNTLTIYCPILYRITDDHSLMMTLNAINNVNTSMAIGKIYLNKNNNTVISYINTILFNDIMNELTTELLDDYISAFIFLSIEFYNLIKEDLSDYNA